MTARIDHEYAERQELDEKRQELLKKKQGLTDKLSHRRDELANLDKEIEKFVDGAAAVEKLMKDDS